MIFFGAQISKYFNKSTFFPQQKKTRNICEVAISSNSWYYKRNVHISVLIHTLSKCNTTFIYYWSEREAKKTANALCSSMELTYKYAAEKGWEITKISTDNAPQMKNWNRIHFMHWMITWRSIRFFADLV